MNVSKAGFYELLKKYLKEKKRLNFKRRNRGYLQEHHGRYGAIRITKVLNKSGILFNRKRIGKMLLQLGLYAKGSTYKYKSYNQKSPTLSRPHLIIQMFQAKK